MTPHIIAHRVAFVANAAAGGDLLAKAELAMAISALEFFDATTCNIFVNVLEPGTPKFLVEHYGVDIVPLNQKLIDLLIERGTA